MKIKYRRFLRHCIIKIIFKNFHASTSPVFIVGVSVFAKNEIVRKGEALFWDDVTLHCQTTIDTYSKELMFLTAQFEKRKRRRRITLFSNF